MNFPCLLILGLSLGAETTANDRATIQAFLSREVIGPRLALTEVQEYTEAHVPRMPAITTAAEWDKYAKRLRADVLERIVYRGEARAWRDAKTGVEWLGIIPGGPGYRIKKLRYEALPGLWVPALLYEPEKLAGKVPAVLNVNGHDPKGKAAPYKQIRCINQAKRGMLALNVEWLGMGQLRVDNYQHYRMNQIDLCGSSGLAPFYLCMKRGLDVLLRLENTDPERVAVTGLSGGGWQTIIISSLDTRVKLCDPVAGYSSFRTRARHTKDLGDSEQTPNDLATIADYTHLTAMLAPRPALLTYNAKDDCCFEAGYALPPLVEAAKPIYKLYGAGKSLRSHINHVPGTHNYEKDNRQAFYRMLGDFFSKDQKWDANEIPSDGEVKSEDELRVELRKPNADFRSLALALCQPLPRDAALPVDRDVAVRWQQQRRAKLRELVRAKPFAVKAEVVGSEEKDGLKAIRWRLKMGTDWTVPVVELITGDPRRTVVLVGEGGRRDLADEAKRRLNAGARVLAVDPFYFGESKIEQRDVLYALLVAGVGDRPLGIQASQTAAVARWARATFNRPVTVVAVGPRSSTFALVAAALETKAIDRLELQGALGSLKEVIEQNRSVNDMPEMFCFGLLEAFDIKQLAALVAPRPVEFVKAAARARKELNGLKAWYGLLGSDFDPLH